LTVNALPDDPAHACEVRVYYFDTDAGGVVHNVAYLRLIEEARTRLAEHLGWSLAEMAAGHEVPVVARTEIDYVRPARLADTLRITGRLVELRSSSFSLEFEVTRPADGAVIARCRQRMVSVRLATGRPVRTPLAWREKWPHLAA
jgi:YbgC/YbaW family acyl-CoA thioester hydrolase